MLFNSFEFVIFFPVVTILYFLLPHKLRWLHLLIASCYFYMAFVPIYILILFFTIIIDYIAGISIENSTGQRRKVFLVLSLVANIGVLAYFKYYNFFVENINSLFNLDPGSGMPYLKILLPIGLSFHTFQAMSYTIEVYRGHQKAERHFGIYALYVMFYPQLVAGPIERPQNILHQFHEKHYISYANAVLGLRQMLWGFIKKVVIADRLALMVNNVYNDPTQHDGPILIIATFFFAIQIYCDFSGYSDIAIGCARVMGFELMTNFNFPFTSKSITEFWRRWHISLSTWFNDYVFNPFVTNYRDLGKFAVLLGLLLTFFLSGFWHGAGWTFIIYGLLHGAAISYEYFTKKQRKKLFKNLPEWLGNTISVVLTFSFVAFSWIFFRASSLHDALYVVTHLHTNIGQIAHFNYLKKILTVMGGNDLFQGIVNMSLSMVFVVGLLFIDHKSKENPTLITRIPKTWRWTLYCASVLCLLLFGVYENAEFIYFQF